jgi:hypothetical protein
MESIDDSGGALQAAEHLPNNLYAPFLSSTPVFPDSKV